MKIVVLQLALLVTFLYTANAHSRLECPPPRSGKTGAKIGPCDADDDLSLPAYPLIPGALNTITWLESLGHPGAPGRLALSLDGADEGFESCILLDHIPHDERSQPSLQNELSYHRASITVFIPDVDCKRCHLQFITVMSDGLHQLPEGEQCAYKGAQTAGTADAELQDCKVVYHSCSPVSINGTIPRKKYECSLDSFVEELEWPFMQGKPPASTYAYKGDPGMYDRQMAVLQSGGKPVEDCSNNFYCDPEKFYQEETVVEEGAKYAELHGTCAAMVNMVVEPFELGKLPSVEGYMAVEVDPCEACKMMELCYSEDACALRDSISGMWSGEGQPCNAGASCDECFPDSPCYRGDETPEEEESATSSPVNSAEASGDVVALRTSVSVTMIGLLSMVVSTLIFA